MKKNKIVNQNYDINFWQQQSSWDYDYGKI